MKPINLITLLICLIIFSLAASAAALDKFMVRGYVFNEEYQPLDSVEVDLKLNDTIPVDFRVLVGDNESRTITGNQLRLMVNGGMGEYCLTLYKEGYDLLIKRFKISSVSENIKYLSTLVMEKERHQTLSEVTVHATRVKMVMKGDTVVFDAAAFQLSEGSMLDALVRQLPGATLSTDGVIEVNGRKINELLVNGKDFFKGDPKVALQNLPAYTVKNLKVYDKVDKDAYLTHSDARIDKREEEENLVMDVVLKKEYDTGYLANAEGGYGTRHRYMGRAFGLGYSDKFRIAAFINANNTGDHTQGGTSGQWRGATSTENGMQDLLTTGLDYNYTNPDRIEASGNLTYTGETEHSNDLTAATRFFSSGDIFGRSQSIRRDKSRAIRTQHYVNYRGSNVYFYVSPSFNWTHTDKRYDNRTADFTIQPEESYRGEAVDSIFAARASGNFTRHMLTRLQKMTAAKGNATDGRLYGNVTIRPKTWKGMLNVNLNGSLSHKGDDTHTYYDQAYGPASQAQDKPVRNDRFTPVKSDARNLYSSVRYSQDFRSFGEKRSSAVSFHTLANYGHNHDENNNSLYISDMLPDPLTPPSAIMPEGLMFDPSNSPLTTTNKNSIGGAAGLSYSSEPIAPGDSTFNLTYGIQFNAAYSHDHEFSRYLKSGITDQSIRRNTDFVSPTVMFHINSSNKVRNISSVIQYSMKKNAPSLGYLIDTYDSSNPLNIFVGNPDGLVNSTTHSVYINWIRIARSASNSRVIIFGSWNVTTDATAMAQRYDPATGINISTPENISGNWSASLGSSASTSFGKQRNITLDGSLDVDVANSADYAAINSTPVRSSVFTQRYRPSVKLDYTLKNGSTLSAGMTVVVENQHSAREGFNNMTWYAYWPYLRAFLKLPAGLELNTQFNPYFRRGYADPEMNTSEYVWNATLSKSFIRPAITLKLSANDILGSAKHVYSSVNAQGRTETWRYTMPRYIMLTVGYRLDMKPRSGKGADSGRRGRGYMMF